jgi:hypothetical protein
MDVGDRLQAFLRDEEDSAGKHQGDLVTPASRTWLSMQRIERYRYRAIQVARQAAGSDAHRGELLDIVAQWLDLARQAERLAQDADALPAGRASAPPTGGR